MGTCCCCFTVSDIILYIVALFFPPFAVAFRSGCCSQDLLLNILLTMLAFIPGMLHAFYYITITSPARNEDNRFFYQQGWRDHGRYPVIVVIHDEEAGVRPRATPGYGSINGPMNQGTKFSGRPPPPPPYSGSRKLFI